MVDVPAAPPDAAVRRLAWASLVFTVAVILGGSVVRATGSGAGCGDHWPRCEGHIIPFSAEGATLIEFTHRAMTATLGLVLVALVIVVLRRTPRGAPMRKALWWSLGFFFGEVVIGAVLVLFGWVDDDESLGRVIAVSLHLVNTFLLLGALTLTAWLASGGRPFTIDRSRTRDRLVVAGVVILLVVGTTGALNALTDTLHPAGTLMEGIRHELGSSAPYLVRLRALHPLVAIAGGGTLFLLTRLPAMEAPGRARGLAGAIQIVIGAQLLMGIVNLALLTPVETQVLHLLLADALWILWILFGAELLRTRRIEPSAVAEAV